ncbi:MAG: hypothetical protein U0165_04075 [Polyangiaceae bacterium]
MRSRVATVGVALAASSLMLFGCNRRKSAPPPPGPVEWIADPLPGAPDTIRIAGIAGPSANDMWAVGWGIFHFDGKAWSEMTPPELKGVGTALTSMSYVSPTNIWAAGVNGHVAHYDGKAWKGEQIESARVSTSPSVKGYFDLLAVTAWENEVWVADSRAGYHRFDGKSWTFVSVPTITGRTIQTLWGSSPADVWSPLSLLHYANGTWSTFATPLSSYEHARGLAPNDVWFAGWRGSSKDSQGAIGRFDGTSIRDVPVPAGTPMLWDVFPRSSDEVYAVGVDGWSLVWDGSSWKPLATGVTGVLQTVFSPAKGVAFAGGTIGPVILRRR